MTIEIAAIFTAAELSQKIMGYLGIIETVENKITQFTGAFLKAGINALIDAQFSNDADNLIRTARDKFFMAIEIEKKERLICSLLGLALCHNYFGDNKNEIRYLNKILDVEILSINIYAELSDATLACVIPDMFLWQMIRRPFGYKGIMARLYDEKMKPIFEIKKQVSMYLNDGKESLSLKTIMSKWLEAQNRVRTQ